MSIFGERIKYIRKINQLNQVEFAKIIDVSQGTLSELEKDKYKPSLDKIISIFNNFTVDIEWLLVNQRQKDNTEDTYNPKVKDKGLTLLLLSAIIFGSTLISASVYSKVLAQPGIMGIRIKWLL
ncbi:helix-turn-helix domain-containing protein [Fredinandcohnia humi]